MPLTKPFEIIGNFGTNPEHAALKMRAESDVNTFIEQQYSHFELQSSEMLPEVRQAIPQIKNWLRERLRMVSGIEDITLTDNIFQIPDETKKEDEGGYSFGGSSKLGNITIPELKGNSRQLTAYQQVIILAHELYHDSAKLTLAGDKRPDGKYKVYPNRSGLGYYVRTKSLSEKVTFQYTNALEEGLAIKTDIAVCELGEKLFPEGKRLHDQLIKKLQKNNLDSLRYLQSEAFFIFDFIDEENYKGVSRSFDPVNLIEFLEEYVPDFERLAERARLNKETLALAKAIEKVFGIGSYRMIASTRELNAGKLLKKLKDRVETGLADYL